MNSVIKHRALFCILFIGILFLTSAAALYHSAHSRTDSYTAFIYHDGKLIRTIALSSSSEEFKIESPDTGYNIIRVDNSSIGIIEANCPDQICVNQGFIKTSLIPITCLPHKLVIEVKPTSVSNHPDSVQDAVTY